MENSVVNKIFWDVLLEDWNGWNSVATTKVQLDSLYGSRIMTEIFNLPLGLHPLPSASPSGDMIFSYRRITKYIWGLLLLLYLADFQAWGPRIRILSPI